MVTVEKMKKYEAEMIEFRRDLHMHPEIGFDLSRTSGRVEERLRSYGVFELITGIAETGIVAVFDSGRPGKTVALRADMDALPMDDEIEAPYKSQVPGAAHTCGHDAHTAMLLGAAHYIAEHQDEFNGRIKLLFQPSEESNPSPGAPEVIKTGILDDCEGIFGLHVDTAYQCGQVGIRYGALYAGSTAFSITVKGHGGHGAYPHLTNDPVLTAAQIICDAQSIVSRNTDPMGSAVVTFGSINSGYAANVIPEKAVLTGTTRALDQQVLLKNKAQLNQIAEYICSMNGCTCETEHEITTPVLFNDKRLTSVTEEEAVRLIGREQVIVQDHAEMGGEDFAYYCAVAPCSFFILGVSNETCNNYCHHPKFDIDENALVIGASLLAAAAQKETKEI